MSRRRGESAEYALTNNQVIEVQAACQDLEERVTISCQLFLGLRVSELAHMRSDWITEEGHLRVPTFQACNCAECKRRRKGEWRPKTKAGARTLPIPSAVKHDLLEMFKIKPYGLSISRVGLYYRTKTVLVRAKVRFQGLADNTAFPHALRATCAMMLALSGMESSALCYFMGWKSLVVGEHYIQTARAKELAIKQAQEAFGK